MSHAQHITEAESWRVLCIIRMRVAHRCSLTATVKAARRAGLATIEKRKHLDAAQRLARAA